MSRRSLSLVSFVTSQSPLLPGGGAYDDERTCLVRLLSPFPAADAPTPAPVASLRAQDQRCRLGRARCRIVIATAGRLGITTCCGHDAGERSNARFPANSQGYNRHYGCVTGVQRACDRYRGQWVRCCDGRAGTRQWAAAAAWATHVLLETCRVEDSLSWDSIPSTSQQHLQLRYCALASLSISQATVLPARRVSIGLHLGRSATALPASHPIRPCFCRAVLPAGPADRAEHRSARRAA